MAEGKPVRINRALDELLQKEVTRQQFLGIIGGILVGIMGFSSLIGLFTKNEATTSSKAKGYGKQGYGP